MGSAFLKSPELIISEDEAKQLATAITAVTELYDVPLVSEKAIAWTNLIMVVGAVEGTRIAAVMLNKKKSGGPVKVGPQPVQGKAPNQPRTMVGFEDIVQTAGTM